MTVDRYNVISFDIFDTLLVRPYLRPTDLFAHLEKLNNATGFKDERIKTENRIRKEYKKLKKVVKFDDIYQHIDKKYKWLKEKELSLEYEVLNPRLLIKDIYDYACQQNKKIIVISDMYLPEQFLSNVLKKNGYTNIDKIFISSEYGKTKYSTLLYKIVIEELKISEKDILHIGDNMYNDIKQARRTGINAYYVPKIKDYLFDSDPQLKDFYKKHKNEIGVSIMLGLFAYHSEQSYKNYWYEFGYKNAGPVIFGYMKWLYNELKEEDINRVLFVGRDGYTLEKVYNLINSSTTTHYFYFPRKVAYAILNYRKKITDEQAKEIKEEFMYYIKQFDIKSDKFAVVDGISYNLSFQKVLRRIFPEKYIRGCYFSVGRKGFKNMKYGPYVKKHRASLAKILQFMMTAPTPPVNGIVNGEPQFREPNEVESEIIKIYPEISKGAVDFARDCIKFFKDLDIYFLDELIVSWMFNFMHNPKDIDKNMFFNIEYSLSVNHDKYQKLFKNWYN